jgi:hypothetical protein
MQPTRFEPPPVVYVAPRRQHELFHALKRLWAGLMLRRAVRLDASQASRETDGADAGA